MIDYLNYKGVGLNWLTHKAFTDRYKTIAEKWKNQPVYKNETELLKVIEGLKNKDVSVIVVKAGTGTGKTVIIPKIALKSEVEERSLNKPWKVAMTIPKTISTKSAGEFAAVTLDAELGKEVGYTYRDSDKAFLDKQKSRIIYMTDGYLLSSTQSDPYFSQYSVIIIDEAHERSKNIDILLYRLRKAVEIRKGDLKVIIISATIDPSIFTHYFCGDNKRCSRVATFSAETSHPVKDIFLSEEKANPVYAVNMALKYHMNKNEAVLFFVPTSKETEKGCDEISKACKEGKLDKKCKSLACAPLYSKLSDINQKIAMGEVINDQGIKHDPLLETENMRYKIVFSTNIAESSVTINGLTVVIDSGLELDIHWDPLRHASVMEKAECTKAQIMQRRGRVGRLSPGTVYYLYDRHNFMKRPEYPAPNILKEDLTDNILTMMKNTKTVMHCIHEFNRFLTPPRFEQIISGFHVLFVNELIQLEFSPETDHKNPFDDFHYLNNLQRFPFGYVTLFGHFTHRFMEYYRAELWEILPFVIGVVLYNTNKTKEKEKEKDLHDIVLFYCLFSVIYKNQGEYLHLFFNPPGSNTKDIEAYNSFKEHIMRRIHYNKNKEHESVLTMFKYMQNMLSVTPYTYINMGFFQRIETDYKNTLDKLYTSSFLKEKAVKYCQEMVSKTPLLEKINKNKDLNFMEKCILYSRHIHLCKPLATSATNKTFQTLRTLTLFKGEFSEGKGNMYNKYGVYEVASIQNKKATFKILTSFPKPVIDTLL